MANGSAKFVVIGCTLLSGLFWLPTANGMNGLEKPRRGILYSGWLGKRFEPVPYCEPAPQWVEPTPVPEPKRPSEPTPSTPKPTTPPAKPEAPRPEAPRPEAPRPDAPQPPAQQPQAPPAQPQQPDSSPFDSSNLSSGLETAGATGSLAPSMLGDFIGVIYRVPTAGPSNLVIDTSQELARARILNRYKIADNTSPIPQSRLIYSYNYFSDAFNSVGDIHRHTFGAELALFDNLFSIEVRQALDSFRSFPGEADTTRGANFRTTFKGLLYRQDSVLVSGGLGIGFPTGDHVAGTPDDNYLLTPFVGYLINSANGRWYIQGFEQIDLPTDDDDQFLLHTDIGFGYRLYQESDGPGMLPWVTAIIPTIELHLYTPIGDDPVGRLAGLVYQDVLNSTIGTVFYFGQSTTLSLGLGIPLSTQKDYDFELQCHLQWFFGSSARSRYAPFAG